MAALKYLCMSDTHLGQDASLLNHKKGLEKLAEYLSGEIAPDGVDKIILMGDITDAVLAAEGEYGPATRNLIETLDGILTEKGKIVFLFGNHDLRLFRDHICGGSGRSKYFVHGLGSDGNINVGKFKGMLCPPGMKGSFEIANPLYIEQSEKRLYIFHHGHHLRCDIHELWWQFRQWNQLGLIQAVIGNDLEFGSPAPGNAATLRDFESCTFPFVTTLWWNEENKPDPFEDRAWSWIHKITKHVKRSRKVSEGCWGRTINDMKKTGISARDVELIRDRYIPALVDSDLLDIPEDKSRPISFIYGDTHDGGLKDITSGGRKVRVVNTGAWITYDEKRHPHCLVYTVDGNDSEKVYECGFGMDYVKECAKVMGRVKKPKNLSEEQIKLLLLLAARGAMD